jgi:hypothetical protein
MADNVTLHLCVLWEDELREAARLLHAVKKMPEGDKRDGMIGAAYQACMVSLWGLTDDRVAVLVGSGEIKARARRVKKAKTPSHSRNG